MDDRAIVLIDLYEAPSSQRGVGKGCDAYAGLIGGDVQRRRKSLEGDWWDDHQACLIDWMKGLLAVLR